MVDKDHARKDREYKIKVTHFNDRQFREVTYALFMKILDCFYEDLKAPSSATKGTKWIKAFEEDNKNPNHHLRQMQMAWKEITSQYSGTSGAVIDLKLFHYTSLIIRPG